jgi:hypothetical protein
MMDLIDRALDEASYRVPQLGPLWRWIFKSMSGAYAFFHRNDRVQ